MSRALLTLALVLAAVAPVAAHPRLADQEDALDREIAAAPGDPELRLRRARIRRERGDRRGAEADLVAARQAAPAEPRVALERARLWREAGDPAGAEAALAEALAGDLPLGERGEALEERARLRLERGDPQGARDDLSAAIEARPTPERYLLRGRIDEAAGDLAAASRGYRAGLERLGGAAVLELALIRVERERGLHAVAIARIDALIRRAPVAAELRIERAAILTAAGDAAAAEAELERALREIEAALGRRASALHVLTRARILAALGRREEALAIVAAVEREHPRLGQAAELHAELRSTGGGR